MNAARDACIHLIVELSLVISHVSHLAPHLAPAFPPYSAIRWVGWLDQRDRDVSRACDGNGDGTRRIFVAEKADKKSGKQRWRNGATVTTNSTGAPDCAQFNLGGHGERYAATWTCLLASIFMSMRTGNGRYEVVSYDIACKFESWRSRFEERTSIIHKFLCRALKGSQEHKTPLCSFTSDEFPQWYSNILEECATELNGKKTKGVLTKLQVHQTFLAFIEIYEMYLHVDTQVVDPSLLPLLSLGKVTVVLPILHGYAHGISCRHQFEIRRILGLGLLTERCVSMMFLA